MTPKRWRRVEDLYHAALARAEVDRAPFLAGACAGDDALQREVESLLAQPGSSPTSLDSPAFATTNATGDIGGSAPNGRRLGVYEVRERIGVGGMGEVFRAHDTKLGRDVAIKILPRLFTSNPDRLARFEREARVLASFNHPHIGAIYGLEEADGVQALVLELVDGDALADRIARGPISIPDVVAIARQIAEVLAAAHERGIIHRDLKPANIKITARGIVKVLDFGIAKILEPSGGADVTTASPVAIGGTSEGIVLGTPAYMSPEQAQGRIVDGRSDVFSFGIVLYEMLTGRRPFSGATVVETLAKILESQPVDLRTLRDDLPAPLASLVEACLEKNRDRRPSAHDVLCRVVAIEQAWIRASADLGALLRRPAVMFPAALVVLAAIGGGVGWWASGREARAARARVPELLQLAERYDYEGFYREARTVVPLLPDDLQIKQVWLNMTALVNAIDSDPPGADVSVRGYLASNADWAPIGRTPIKQVRLPFAAVRVRVSKDGYAAFEGTLNVSQDVKYKLDPVGSVPEGMVHVPASVREVQGITLSLPDYWIDRFEVTNRQFKTFVDAGGYRMGEYWKDAIVENGRELAWDEAMGRFRDKTGRPGPSTWELGSYLDGQADAPVAGISWHEAAAYAAFAGKALPTVFQWRAASGIGSIFSDIITVSNFGTNGPAAVGSHAGLGPYGTYDMAGNVKEWCWNASAAGRMILGGGWNESSYKFLDLDAQPSLQRLPNYGFRLVTNLEPQPDASRAAILSPTRDYSTETPVDDATFASLRELYRYDPRPLDEKVERSEDTPHWRRETITFAAAYGGERVIAHLYLPKSASPPYQTVVYFPGGDAPNLRSSRELRLTTVDFIMRSGRALVYPVYKGTYERWTETVGVSDRRDVAIASVKDFGRVMELIDSRPELDRERIAFYGDSRGAFYGVLIIALQPRLRASVLLGAGFASSSYPRDVDPFNFAPRVTVPTLMVAGKSDFLVPVETAQKPLFRFLGVADEHKRHRLFDGGHAPGQLPDVIREILDWFDRYLGPVEPRR